MMTKVSISPADPASPAANSIMAALWDEIQKRYGFEAPMPFSVAAFTGPRSQFWLAFINDQPVGSIAISPLSDTEAELDMMYVAPSARGTGIAHELLMHLEAFAREKNFELIKLRTGTPQPEAIRFYDKEGFSPTPVYGKWMGDDTALCLEKKLQ